MVCYAEGVAQSELRNAKIERAARIRASARSLLSLRTSNPEELAFHLSRNCVKRGVRWLNRNAPNRGWWRNCLNSGRSRVRMAHGDSGILSLVYEYDPDMADEFGYVIDAVVFRKLGFGFPSQKANRLGFVPGSYISGFTPFSKRYPAITIESETLDRAWAEFLENPTPEMRCNFRHDRSIAHWTRSRRKPFLEGMANRLRIRRLYDRILPRGRLARV